MQERLWVILLPALLLSALTASAWTCFLLREHEQGRRVEDIQHRLEQAVHRVAGEIGHAVQTSDRDHYTFLVESLALATGGTVTLRHRTGALLAQNSAVGRPTPGTATGVAGSIEQVITVAGPILGAGGARLGELRIHARMPDSLPFPWSVWSALFAAFSLLAAAVLFLVTRILAPLGKLGELFRRIGRDDPRDIDVPDERFAEFGQLREDIVTCLDGLARRQIDVEESFVEVALGLAREYEYHREGRIGHGQRTRRYASWVADRLRLSPRERDELEVAALCHDLGKVPAAGGDSETVPHAHPAAGAAYFEVVPGLDLVAHIIHCHHENYDGTGFPEGLTGEAIPIGARILRIADAFERLYSDEDATMTVDEALLEMEEGRGRDFDPALLDLFREEAAVRLAERRRHRVALKARRPEQLRV